MARKYKPIELDVKPVAGAYLNEAATCPQCSSRITEVLGRMGLRLVFRCERRAPSPTPNKRRSGGCDASPRVNAWIANRRTAARAHLQ